MNRLILIPALSAFLGAYLHQFVGMTWTQWELYCLVIPPALLFDYAVRMITEQSKKGRRNQNEH